MVLDPRYGGSIVPGGNTAPAPMPPSPYTPPKAPTTPPAAVPPNAYKGPVDMSINNTQQGADLVNANKDQAAKMGITLPGSTYQPTATTSTTTTTPTTTTTGTAGTPDQQKRIADAQAALDAKNAEIEQVGNKAYQDITNLSNGTTPLTSSEQAQVDGLKNQFQNLINDQLTTNTNAVGLANVRGYQKGAAEYDAQFQIKTIGGIASAGAAKVADLQTKEAAAVASLTQSFKDNDIQAVKDAWDIYQKTSQDVIDARQKTIDDTQAAIKEANDARIADEKAALDQEANMQAWQKIQDSETQNAQTNARENALAESTIAKNKIDSQKTLADIQAMSAGGIANTLGPVSTNSFGTPNLAQQQAFLAQIAQTNPGLALQIKAAADYKLDPSKLASLKGNARMQFDSLVRQYDPSYDSATYPAKAAYVKTLQSAQYSLAINSANKTINHLTSLFDSLDKMNNFNLGGPMANAVTSAIESPFNPDLQTRMATVTTESQGVAQEMEKFFKGTGVSDVEGIKQWQSSLSPNLTPAAQAGLKQGALQLFTGQLDTLYAQYRQNMGNNPPIGAILQPETLTKLAKLGVDTTNYTQGTPLGAVTSFQQTNPDMYNQAVQQIRAINPKFDGEDVNQQAEDVQQLLESNGFM